MNHPHAIHLSDTRTRTRTRTPNLQHSCAGCEPCHPIFHRVRLRVAYRDLPEKLKIMVAHLTDIRGWRFEDAVQHALTRRRYVDTQVRATVEELDAEIRGVRRWLETGRRDRAGQRGVQGVTTELARLFERVAIELTRIARAMVGAAEVHTTLVAGLETAERVVAAARAIGIEVAAAHATRTTGIVMSPAVVVELAETLREIVSLPYVAALPGAEQAQAGHDITTLAQELVHLYSAFVSDVAGRAEMGGVGDGQAGGSGAENGDEEVESLYGDGESEDSDYNFMAYCNANGENEDEGVD